MALHSLVFAVVIGLALKTHAPAGSGAVAITVVGSAPSSGGVTKPDPFQRLQTMNRALAPETPGSSNAPSPSRPQSLSSLFGDPDKPPSGAPAPGRPAPSRAASGDGADPDIWSHASFVRPAAKGASSLDIRAQAERCWSGPRGRIPVKLTVTLDESGEVVVAPQPIRPMFARVDASRQAAEARAAEAIEACAPYRLSGAASGRHTYELDFAG